MCLINDGIIRPKLKLRTQHVAEGQSEEVHASAKLMMDKSIGQFSVTFYGEASGGERHSVAP